MADRMSKAYAMRRLAQMTGAGLSDEQLAQVGVYYDVWQAGVDYGAGDVLRHGEGLYRVEQAHMSQGHQPPDGAGMLAIYRPVQVAEPGEVLPWVSGEVIVFGDVRSFGGVNYRCYVESGAGANVHSPDLVPAIWEIV